MKVIKQVNESKAKLEQGSTNVHCTDKKK